MKIESRPTANGSPLRCGVDSAGSAGKDMTCSVFFVPQSDPYSHQKFELQAGEVAGLVLALAPTG